MITKKDHLIEYFKSGIKNTNEFKIGIEHEKLSFYHNGIQRRLTNVAGHVVQGILS